MTEAEDRAKKVLKKLLVKKDAIVDKKIIGILLSFINSKGLLDEYDEYFKEYIRR